MSNTYYGAGNILEALNGKTITDISEDGKSITFSSGETARVQLSDCPCGVTMDFRGVKPGFTFRKFELYRLPHDNKKYMLEDGEYGTAVFIMLNSSNKRGYSDDLIIS